MNDDIVVRAPSDVSPRDFEIFYSLIVDGSEVDAHGLRQRIRSAARLLFRVQETSVVAVGAVKIPAPLYRERLTKKAGVDLSEGTYRYELGWIYVIPSFRGRGISRELVACAIEFVANAGCFATSRTDNFAMHKTLARFAFKEFGRSYRSDDGEREIQFFGRPVR